VACLDEQAVLDMVEGRLSPAERRAAVAHADGCADCRELIAGAAAQLVPEGERTTEQGSPQSLPETTLRPGGQVGRYRILDLVGAGGMGVVYAAYDPELDRRVALKLVRGAAGPDAESQRARLQREARAIARVSHPNVVAVHDVGAIGEQVFIAMEFVEGATLKHWLEAAPRPVGERLEVMLQAGRGLLAAHRAGLVHRDFKPDNVLVGKDGRVRVTDFGLARPPGDLAQGLPRSEDLNASPDEPLTRTGAFVGTPAYMAPEQMRGGSIDPRADVFSFAVATWECLYGARPFAGGTAEELARAVNSGRFTEPSPSEVPPRIRRALTGALAADPDQRPRTLEPLLADLAPEARRRSRAVWWLAAALLALVVGGVRLAQRARDRAECTASGQRIIGAWDGSRKQAVLNALGDSETVRALTATLDRYATAWSQSRVQACEATRVRGEQPVDSMTLRVECLEQRRRELDAFVARVAQSPRHLEQAAVRAHQLVSIAECDDVTSLKKVLRPSVSGPALDALRSRLAALMADRFVADNKSEGAESAALTADAIRVGAFDVAAGALLVEGATRQGVDDFEGAAASLKEAAIIAAMAHDDVQLAHVLVRSIIVEGVISPHFEAAQRLIAYAQAVVRRLGGSPRAEWELLDARGQVAWRAGRLAEAEELQRAAFAWYERSGESDPLDRAALLVGLADTLGDAGRTDDSTRLYDEVLQLYRAALGPEHLQVLQVENNRAIDRFESGHTDEAIAAGRRVLAAFARHPEERDGYANALNSMGWFLTDSDPREAEKLYRQSIDLYQSIAPIDELALAQPLSGLGWTQLALGRRSEALVTLERALAMQTGTGVPATDLAETELALAHALGSGPRALHLARHAHDVLAANPLGVRRAKLVTDAQALTDSLSK
jgi:eukaryotic-like serine/threonine-protein kinase